MVKPMSNEPTGWISGIRRYVSEVRLEVNKITWPANDEAMTGTIGVVVIVAVIATVLGLVDFGLSRVMQVILQ